MSALPNGVIKFGGDNPEVVLAFHEDEHSMTTRDKQREKRICRWSWFSKEWCQSVCLLSVSRTACKTTHHVMYSPTRLASDCSNSLASRCSDGQAAIHSGTASIRYGIDVIDCNICFLQSLNNGYRLTVQLRSMLSLTISLA